VTHLRRVMLEELQRRNYAKTTIQSYIRAVERFAKYFLTPPDQLNHTHLRTYQAYLLREHGNAFPNDFQRKDLAADLHGERSLPGGVQDGGAIFGAAVGTREATGGYLSALRTRGYSDNVRRMKSARRKR
jgi:Phage integrase, N-terminal SAM-like domain